MAQKNFKYMKQYGKIQTELSWHVIHLATNHFEKILQINVSFLGDVGVPVEYEGSCVGVSSLAFPNQPIVHLASWENSALQSAHLVDTIASRAEDGGGNLFLTFEIAILLLVKDARQTKGHRNSMIIDDVVERAVNSIIDVQCLEIVVSSLARVHLRGNRSGRRNEETTRLSNEAHTAGQRLKARLEVVDGSADSSRQFGESWQVSKEIHGVSRESTTNVNDVHMRKS